MQHLASHPINAISSFPILSFLSSLFAFSYFLSLFSSTVSLQMGWEGTRTLNLSASSPACGASAWYSPSLLPWDYKAKPMDFYLEAVLQLLFLSPEVAAPCVSSWSQCIPFSEAGDCHQPRKGGWRTNPQGKAGGREQMGEGKPHKHAKRVQ